MIELALSCPYSSCSDCGCDSQSGDSPLRRWGEGQEIGDSACDRAFEPAVYFKTKYVRKTSLSLFTRSFDPCSWGFLFLVEQFFLSLFIFERYICPYGAQRPCSVPGVVSVSINDCQMIEEHSLSHYIRLLVMCDSKPHRFKEEKGTY